MKFPIRIIPDDTRIPFMRWAKYRNAVSLVLCVFSFFFFFTWGVNEGIDFKGGILIEVHDNRGEADIAGIREKVGSLDFGDVQITTVGTDSDVLIRIAAQEGGESAQQSVVEKVREALGTADYEYRRVEVVGPRVSGELARTGFLTVGFTIAGIMIYIWFRFEWQFAVAAVATLVHDAILTMGFFAVTQIDFNLQSIAAILTILGYSLNDTVVIFDRIREMLRKYKTMPLSELIDLATNQTLARTIMTSVTTLLSLIALYLFGGPVVQSFTAAMIWGVFVATASSIFIGGPILIYFNLRPRADKDDKGEAGADATAAKVGGGKPAKA